jgi:hypothetical protein
VLQNLAIYCPKLLSIDLSDSHLSAQALSYLTRFRQLISLNLEYCPIDDQKLCVLIDALPGLRCLNVSRCDVGDKACHAIARQCKHLQGTIFNAIFLLVCLVVFLYLPNSITHLLICSPVLEMEETKTTDAGLQSIASQCKELRAITVYVCDVTDRSLMALAVSCFNLEVLDIGHTNATDSVIKTVKKMLFPPTWTSAFVSHPPSPSFRVVCTAVLQVEGSEAVSLR